MITVVLPNPIEFEITEPQHTFQPNDKIYLEEGTFLEVLDCGPIYSLVSVDSNSVRVYGRLSSTIAQNLIDNHAFDEEEEVEPLDIL